ncbi:hypothetical protein K435DRAFT_863372 [Dendrothele bispora CBS 962.96]|uniref:CCHC-type domain-containing protein n=1 Tax=Dendrothele bispora (strain CBS 962.96) TaxID=1314807 RepID=A0A4S8LQ20_DENBC|nr:hypothetical protein K435DRAFT_863372 [Dendrothele bispora CBS 962.96]
MENGLRIASLHEWTTFVKEFGRLFGLHDEVLHAQSTLDKVIQQFGESFVDFIVRFEDAALKTLYNDPAKRWRLLLQIRKDLRDRLTLVGRIPESFTECVKRLLDIDGAREAFKETGLSVPNYTGPIRRVNMAIPRNGAQAGPGPGTLANSSRFKSNSNEAQAKAVQMQEQVLKGTVFRISREERDRRMNEGLCIRCRERGHFGKECKTYSTAIMAKAAFEIEEPECESSEILYAIDHNGDLHQVESEDEEEALPYDVNEQGNEEGAQNLEEREE